MFIVPRSQLGGKDFFRLSWQLRIILALLITSFITHHLYTILDDSNRGIKVVRGKSYKVVLLSTNGLTLGEELTVKLVLTDLVGGLVVQRECKDEQKNKEEVREANSCLTGYKASHSKNPTVEPAKA